MTEQELVQEALARLPRPTQPPRLHRQIMAQVQTEARTEATASQPQIWRQDQGEGWQKEWRQGTFLPAPIAVAAAPSMIRSIRRHDGNEMTFYQQTQQD